MKTNMRKINLLTLVGGAAVFLAACSFTGGEVNLSGGVKKNAKISTYMTDAPNEDLVNVMVNVKQIEVWVEGKGKAARLITSEGLGLVDLLRLQNGALMPLHNLNLPADTMVKKFRIILEHEGHYATRLDGTRCDMQTPSAEKSGLKINLNEGLLLESGSAYSIVIDFDAKKSIVQKGNGGCLLKPVLKLKSAIRYDIDDSLNESMDDVNHEDDLPVGDDIIADEVFDNIEDSLSDGFDFSDPTTWPSDMTEEEFNALF